MLLYRRWRTITRSISVKNHIKSAGVSESKIIVDIYTSYFSNDRICFAINFVANMGLKR